MSRAQPTPRLTPRLLPALLALLVLAVAPVRALTEAQLQQRLAGYLAHSALSGASTSCVAWDLPAGRSVFSAHAARPLIPASLAKLLVSGTAVELYGPGFAFNTSVWAAQAPAADGKLTGDLVLVGWADPLATEKLFPVLAGQLAQRGVKSVTGDLVGCAPVLLADHDRGLSGARRLAAALGQRGLQVAGAAREGAAAAAPVLLGKHVTSSLADYLRKMNKPSDNAAADRLLGSVLACFQDPVAPDADFVLRYWSARGLETADLHLADGSGLSRHSRLSSALLVGVLNKLDGDSEEYRVLSRSFPVAGRDGTLAGRMQGTEAAGRVRAKTGTLPQVSCLAGYIEVKERAQVAFSLMFNGLSCSAETARRLQDQMAVEMTRYALSAAQAREDSSG